MSEHPFEYIIENTNSSTLSYSVILKHCSEAPDTYTRGFFDVVPLKIEVNAADFINPILGDDFPRVSISQIGNSLLLTCGCSNYKKKLCRHQAQVLYNIIDKQYFRIFFDANYRNLKLRQEAKDYGLEKEANLDDFFTLEYANKSFVIKPRAKELLALNLQTRAYLKDQLLESPKKSFVERDQQQELTQTILVLGMHRFYDQFNIELFECPLSKEGKPKNPLLAVDPLDKTLKAQHLEEAKFYTGISKFQRRYDQSKIEQDLEGLKAVVENPLGLSIYYHTKNDGEKPTAGSLTPVELKHANIDLKLSVDLRDNFYEISGEAIINDNAYPLKTVTLKFGYFILLGNILYLISNPNQLRVIDFFKKHNQKVLIHTSKFEEFREHILAALEHQVEIQYSYIKPATAKQIKEHGFDQGTEKIIYLSDEANYVCLTPVMKYGSAEIPVLSRKQVQDTDQNGNVFHVERDHKQENHFVAVLIRQHPDFEDQIHQGQSLYLRKKVFLDEAWFLNTFEVWRHEGIKILGFNEIKNNKLNAHKATVSIHVACGINWFETSIDVNFGTQKAALKQLHKSIRSKSKFVQLDDGTLGILPQEWIHKFKAYFDQGELDEHFIKTSKSNFLEINRLYEDVTISQEAKQEIVLFESKLSNFENIQPVAVPSELKTQLREYQKQGLNWLNFLDDYNLGACLADDMGLGKTVQIIAFILLQRSKHSKNTNLIVVPTSLLFNWQEEVTKFAPSIKIFIYHGNNKIKDVSEFNNYEIVLTTYGTLLTEIKPLRSYRFNYVFLDESQAIKNPDSQRYKAAQMLQSRNRAVLTGTPIENNTFDLYGQLSFACPGLLGSKQQFKDLYSTPIDKFDDKRRAKELQRKINPFILRRTKKQVATELPEKTEMVIYCEMNAEQRKVYDLCEEELRQFVAATKDEDLPKNSMYVLQGITKLRQICNSPVLLKDEEIKGESSAKMDVLLEQIETKSEQHKILVFSQFVSMLDLIKKELENRKISFQYLTGQTTQRGAKVSDFQTNDKVRVFLISLKAGGTGLNLTEADYVYLVDPWWNPAVENQAIDRSYRIGQSKHVMAVRLICPNTIEDKMIRLQKSKMELANDLIKTDTSILKSLSKQDLLNLLR